MKNLMDCAAASIGFVLLVVVIAFLSPQSGHGTPGAKDGNTKEMALVNAPTVALPVSVQNTPTVNAQQNGTWNVGISGTPTVAVAGPVPVTVGQVSVRPSLEGTFSEFPSGDFTYVGPMPVGQNIAVTSVTAFARTNQDYYHVGFVAAFVSDPTRCTVPPMSNSLMYGFYLADGKEIHWTFPTPLIFPSKGTPVPTTGYWCLAINGRALVTGFYVDPLPRP